MSPPFDESLPEPLAALPSEILEEINRLWTIARAFTNTAHDLNNALQVISGNAELMEQREDLDPAVARRLTTIREQAGRAAHGVGRLLTYVRGGPDAPVSIDLAELTAAAVAMRTSTLGRAGITLTFDRQGDQPCPVTAEPRRLLQLLLNLLLMAESACVGGGQIAVRLERRPGEAALTVDARAAHSAGGAQSATPDSRRALVQLQSWAVKQLAAAQQATMTVAEEHNASSIRLSWPSRR